MWHWKPAENGAGKRCVLLHYHIFKNAGTTVSFVLKRNFGRRAAFLDSGDFNAVIGNDKLVEFLRAHAKVRAVSSHQLRPPKPADEQFLFQDILLLRDPLTRLSSTYDFYRRTGVTEDPLSREAKRRNTADFMRLLIEEYPYHVDNVQVNYLAALNRQTGKSDLETAFQIACNATVLGVTELFDIAAVTAEYRLNAYFPGLNFGYVAQNVSSSQPRALEIHLAQFRDACGDQIYDQLLQRNSLDVKLLDLARREAERRFELIPGHEERLKHFLAWRSILHPSSVRGVLASHHSHDFVHYANIGIN